ncbi:hypothetical protein LSCM1_03084 [Leishmania martiniquensis]|uniref:Homologous recombination OB-fold protein OB-fold domain-containing protein n=1 Tax=Leishmania martiniquensis TaxID=1580590 RepID=A0A836KFH6_9TRYP|nr:hypothetical protein LSCM1_03084 [Leishmania martiniquensis]
MDPQAVLESLAREKGIALTHLSQIASRYSQSAKVACCGGLMMRLVTESAADSTVLLRDGSGSCFCALHGDITNRYPDVLTTGALLLFTDITVLVVSSKVPPMLIACVQNLAGLLLPDNAANTAPSAASRSAEAVGRRPAPARTTFALDSAPDNDDFTRAKVWQPHLLTSERRDCSRVDPFNNSESAQGSFVEPHHSARPILSPDPARSRERYGSAPAKRIRTENATAFAALEVDDEDDAECLELVDGM